MKLAQLKQWTVAVPPKDVQGRAIELSSGSQGSRSKAMEGMAESGVDMEQMVAAIMGVDVVAGDEREAEVGHRGHMWNEYRIGQG